MSNTDKELIRILQRIKNRLHAKRLIDYVFIGLAGGLLVGCLIIAASKFVPIIDAYIKLLYVLGAAVAASAAAALLHRPGSMLTAAKTDSLGLKERTITALELIKDQSSFARLEKEDTLKNLKSLDYKAGIPLRPNKRYAVMIMILALVLALTGFLPNTVKERTAELKEQKQKLLVQQKKLDEIIKQVRSDPRLIKQQKEELEKQLKELKKEVSSAKTDKDLDKALMKADKKLELIKKDSEQLKQSMDKLINTLSKNQTTKAMADMLKNKDSEALKQELKELEKVLKDMKPEDAKKLAESLSELSKELEGNPELAKALAELSDKLARGELGNLSNELGQLGEAMEKLMDSEELRTALSELSQQLQSMQSGKKAAPGQSPGDNGHQSAGGQGSQQGQGQGQGQGQQGGQGQGTGSGAGSGTDMGSESPKPTSPGSSGITKSTPSDKKVGEYEKIFTSKTLGGDGESSNLSGQKGEGGNTEQSSSDKSNAVRGEAVPYNQVLGQYTRSALESMEASDIPMGMRDLVKDYFTSLGE